MSASAALPVKTKDSVGLEPLFGEVSNPDYASPEGKPFGWFHHLVNYTQTASGAFRCLQLGDRVLQLVSLVLERFGNTLSEYFGAIANRLGTACSMMNCARLPQTTREGWASLREGWQGSRSAFIERIQKIADAAASWLYAAAVFLPNVMTSANVVNLFADVYSVVIAATDINEAHSQKQQQVVVEGAKDIPPIVNRLSYTMKEAFMRLVAKVSSIVTSVSGLMALSSGGPSLLLPLPTILLKLVSTLSAMGAHFYTKTRDLALIQFNKPISPQLCISAATA
ncbi:MAG: hypothetical protein ACD_17C00020G0006 [uncultured bacterium]|nr:MAG: hypothetical protein ACD_17C00020G0006 [uncultured bacterium]OGN55732.1 MAG: hypothetical protein A2796_01010 [Chlamydiae bacterium RIFCSPHIGHO2_01_FULL_44_39]OGN58575.1 MAG: hypothetical protein A3C42_00660 [Chlamydiae bacterium RIFCSPHIGHO2_02_FULL_45_9]OGN60523.1 MAG: hypothetical protein A3D96_01435 [Chlamydiae bacterium RIFCSPHIGHO2_12_FULL_44_59]OGN65978.1 MAG: hypothetical protein A2978_04725 [Chlamydiae bacterium RIFCSPLOWO2_01_FULL_44_52]OGN68793.1 MAG: hypothetical protein A3